MATIKRNTGRVGPQLVGAGRVVGGPDVGRALTGASDAVFNSNKQGFDQQSRLIARENSEAARKAEQSAAKAKRLADASAASKMSSDAKVRMTELFREHEENSEDDGEGLADAVSESLDKLYIESLDNAPNDDVRVALQRSLDQTRPVWAARAQQAQAKKSANFHVTQLNESINQTASGLVSAPEELDVELGLMNQQMALLRDAGFDQAKIDDMQYRAANQMTVAAVNGLIMRDPAGTAGLLREGAFDDELDGSQKVSLINQADARFKAQNAVGSSALKAAGRDASAGLLRGFPVSDAQQLSEALAGTAEGAELARAMAVQPAIAKFRALPLAAMAEQMSGLERAALDGKLSSQEIDVYRAQQAVYSDMRTQYKQDGLRAFATNHLGQELPSLSDIAAREEIARGASLYAGVDVAPVTREEAGIIAQTVKGQALATDAASALQPLAGYSDNSRRKIAALSADIDPGTSLAMAYSGNRPEVAASILRGQKSVKDVVAKDTDVFAALSDSHRQVFSGNPAALNQAMTAAKAIYADKMARSGLLPTQEFNRDLYQESLDEAIGGRPIQFEGTAILPPAPEIDTPGQVKRLLNSLDDADLLKYGSLYNPSTGQQVEVTEMPFTGGVGGQPVQQITAADLSQAALRNAKSGQYFVEIGTGAIMGAGNQVYVLDLERFVKDRGAPAPIENSFDALGSNFARPGLGL